MKIIDSHIHIYPEFLKKDRDKIAAHEPWFDILSSSKVQKWGTAEELVSKMDESGVDMSVATTFAFRDIGLCREMNDYVLEASRKFPKRIVPLAVVPPTAKGAVREAERVLDAGAVGVGELFPDGQSFSIAEAEPLRGLCETVRERGKFITFHTAEQAGHNYAGKGTCGAREAAAFCRNFPLVRVIFAHFGGGLWAFYAMPEMRSMLANAMFDTAAMPWLYGAKVLDAMYAIGAGEKILYGSDWPILSFERYSKLLEKTKLSHEETEMLLHRNAEKFICGETK
ncbi:MAG: amidohydrolase family protein [Synergistes sp.]|nr:amidohydrolase family protein [Synergistes sp.]